MQMLWVGLCDLLLVCIYAWKGTEQISIIISYAQLHTVHGIDQQNCRIIPNKVSHHTSAIKIK